MRQAWSQTQLFLIPYAALLIAALLTILITDKNELHLWFNQLNHPVADQFFKYATRFAEGWAIGALVFLALVYKLRHGIAVGIGLGLSGMLTQSLKRMVFSDSYRPVKVFEGLADLHMVDGVLLHKLHSFPSGHATVAFAMGLGLAFLLPKTWMKLSAFAFALAVAFSRVYLSQHFFEDITAGSVVGSTVMFVLLAGIGNQNGVKKG